ncbi:DEAD/H (AspGluAlaAsp/His) box helicase 11 [Caligus rogercresseyi]|uniref:DEAD/H (AspGluAlaAsp/His) box helicase 11 n=1 Tax=Caligus rogercresseyi TaxID=217165 RepID=A0A7T8KJK3_CALRO|nr:DEAD/H (AspGluAlaAsp/His) box helicase 11 [Caligus rogercresseyi]
MSTLDFLHEAQIFNINLVRLLHYISKSKLAFKLRGFAQRYQDKPNPAGVVVLSNTTQSFLKSMKKDKDDDSAQAAQNTERKSNEDGSLPLNALSSFLACIIEDLDEGRVLDLVRDCHSIIVAGGTMDP